MRTKTKTHLLRESDIGFRAAATFMIHHGKLPVGFVETFLAQAFK